MVDPEYEERLRLSAFAYMNAVMLAASGGPVRRADVSGFVFEDRPVPLMDQMRGIWKPKGLSAPLSFTKSLRPGQIHPYDDTPGGDGLFRYKWQGKDPSTYTNAAMRKAIVDRVPLIMFYAVDKAVYQPILPVYVVGEEPESKQFVIAFDEVEADHWDRLDQMDLGLVRRYATSSVRRRVHQPAFRSVVLDAYERRCALCNLRHVELLDAAHIRPDSEGGEPVVTNGIAMCKIHHASYDQRIMGIRPDHEIRVRPDVLAEEDGPTLRYSLQGLHGQRIHLPRRKVARPAADLLEERWERFLETC